MLEHELQTLLESKIPISVSLGTKVISIDESHLKLILPLNPNRNHKGTLFGGSLYSACALACYGLFLWNLKRSGINTEDIVISEGSIQYLKPVHQDAEIIAEWSNISGRDSFFKVLSSKKKARTEMQAQIIGTGAPCVLFTGQFVARL